MLTIRCTKKLQKHLGIVPNETPPPPTSALGDWYANLVPTAGGDLILFLNEKSLLTVAIPAWESDDLIPLFQVRVANLLLMIDIPPKVIQDEIRHYQEILFGNTANRSLLGSMNDFAINYQIKAEYGNSEEPLSLSRAEFDMSEVPCKSLKFQFPSDIAKELLGVRN